MKIYQIKWQRYYKNSWQRNTFFLKKEKIKGASTADESKNLKLNMSQQRDMVAKKANAILSCISELQHSFKLWKVMFPFILCFQYFIASIVSSSRNILRLTDSFREGKRQCFYSLKLEALLATWEGLYLCILSFTKMFCWDEMCQSNIKYILSTPAVNRLPDVKSKANLVS